METQTESINFNEIYKRLQQIERVLQRSNNNINNNNYDNNDNNKTEADNSSPTLQQTTNSNDGVDKADSTNHSTENNTDQQQQRQEEIEEEKEKPLLYYIDKLEKHFDHIKTVQLSSFFQRLNRYGLNINTSDAAYNLDFDVKLAMVLQRDADVISKAATLAPLIENHLQYLQYSFLTQVNESRAKLQPLEELNAEQIQRAVSLSSQLTSILCYYNEIIHTLSHKFVLWNKNLSELEERVDALLLKKGTS